MNSWAPAPLKRGHQGRENMEALLLVSERVLSLEMCNHSSYCLLTGVLFPQNLCMANSHKTCAASLGELRGTSISSGSWPSNGTGFLGLSCRPQGNQAAGLTAPPDLPTAVGNSPHFPLTDYQEQGQCWPSINIDKDQQDLG